MSDISCCYTCTNCNEGYFSNATGELYFCGLKNPESNLHCNKSDKAQQYRNCSHKIVSYYFQWELLSHSIVFRPQINTPVKNVQMVLLLFRVHQNVKSGTSGI